MNRILITSMIVAALLAFASVASAQDAKGEKVYADQKCSLCHSIAGKGNPKGPLDDVGSKLKPEEIRQWIVDPTTMRTKTKAERNPPMPNKFASLPKGDIDALVTYLASLKKK